MRIIIVDDNETDIKITLKILEQLGRPYTTEIFNDGREALDFFIKQDPADQEGKPDLILLDVVMPYMDGYTFIRETKTIPYLRGVPIIVFTSQEAMGDLFKVEGAIDYVVKSFYADELIEKIKRHLNY